jgi:hypothetical protein
MVNKNINSSGNIKQVQQLILNSEINRNQNVIDPVTADQHARYKSEGLTYISNNESIIPRDAAGNILLTEESMTNPLLIIDPVTELVTTKSILKVIDTSFQYYKFPVSIRPNNNIDDLVIDLDFESDSIATRFTIPAEIDAQGQPQTYQRIATSEFDDWFTNGGELTSGTSRLPFVGGNQAEIGSYTITPDVLNTLQSRNKTLKFSIQTQFTSVEAQETPPFINATADEPETSFTMTLKRSMPEIWRSTGNLPELYSESNGSFGPNEYPFFQLEYVIDIMNDAAPYDKYFIDVQSNKRSWVLTENCFWKIDVIDIPTTPSLNGTIGYGVYSFSNNCVLREVTNAGSTTTDIFTKDETGRLIRLPELTFDNLQVSSTNPTPEDIDETYPPFGEAGTVNGATRVFFNDDSSFRIYTWSSNNDAWI